MKTLVFLFDLLLLMSTTCALRGKQANYHGMIANTTRNVLEPVSQSPTIPTVVPSRPTPRPEALSTSRAIPLTTLPPSPRKPSPRPTLRPTPRPTPIPTLLPTPLPTPNPTPLPTRRPTPSRPSRRPTRKPTSPPTSMPSSTPLPSSVIEPTTVVFDDFIISPCIKDQKLRPCLGA